MSYLHSRTLLALLTAICCIAVAKPFLGYAEAPQPVAPSTAEPTKAPLPPKPLQASEQGATARCRDGTYYHGATLQSTCAGHGGVARWMRGANQGLIR